MTMRKRYVEKFTAINQDVLKMGTLVEEAIRKSMQALKDKDLELAKLVVDEDKIINQMELDIQDECIALIATEHPVAGDLRALITIIKIVSQLERMGDHALHVAKGALRLAGETYMKKLMDLPRMADCAIRMIHEVLTAFINNDQEKALEVARMDDEIDALHNQVMRECLTYMLQDPKYIPQATSFLFISRFLERLGDHVTNISEWICYNITGKHRELNQ